MNKLLSVCIPSYNMESYLPRNLDSFISSDCLDALELLIINDGSTDATLEVARKYQKLYPNSIKVIDKKNGHYGSCVNTALAVAQGKYFRIVDADDMVDSAPLKDLVLLLPDINSDVIYTRFCSFYERDNHLEINEDPIEAEWGKATPINDVNISSYIHMHQLWYRTEFLRQIEYKQTEGICYTDTEYVFMPLSMAKDIYALKYPIYRYFIGRDDQSMAPSVLMKNFTHLNKVFKSIYNYRKDAHSNSKFTWLQSYYMSVLYGMMVDCLYASQCRNHEWDESMREATEMMSLKGNDISKFLNQTIRGRKWFKWWHENTFFSKSKLKCLFFLINARHK